MIVRSVPRFWKGACDRTCRGRARLRGSSRRYARESYRTRPDDEMVCEAMGVPPTQPALHPRRERCVESPDDRKPVRPAEVPVAIHGVGSEAVVSDKLQDLS